VLVMISMFARFITRPRGESGRHTVITQSPSAGIGLFIAARRQLQNLTAVGGDTSLGWVLPPTIANAEEPIPIVSFAAERIPVAYQTDRKPFRFRSGFWLPGDYGSTP
jgi:hypothetical protein